MKRLFLLSLLMVPAAQVYAFDGAEFDAMEHAIEMARQQEVANVAVEKVTEASVGIVEKLVSDMPSIPSPQEEAKGWAYNFMSTGWSYLKAAPKYSWEAIKAHPYITAGAIGVTVAGVIAYRNRDKVVSAAQSVAKKINDNKLATAAVIGLGGTAAGIADWYFNDGNAALRVLSGLKTAKDGVMNFDYKGTASLVGNWIKDNRKKVAGTVAGLGALGISLKAARNARTEGGAETKYDSKSWLSLEALNPVTAINMAYFKYFVKKD